MGSNLKRFLSVPLATMLCTCLTVTAYARYINEIDASYTLSISGGTTSLYSEMYGSDDITKVVMTQVLQKKSGSSYTNVTGTISTEIFYNDSAPYMTSTATVSEAGTYRVKTTYKVTSPKGTDTHTAYKP